MIAFLKVLLGTNLAAFMTVVVAVSAAQSAEIKIIAANAIKEGYGELVTAFERSTGHTVVTTWSGTVGATKRIQDGQVFDLVLIGSKSIDKLIADGKLSAGSRTDFAKSGVGIAVRAGMPKPDVSSSEAVKKAVLSAKSVAYSAGPSGAYVANLLKSMGIAEQIKDKVKQPSSGAEAAHLVARGEAELGFAQVSEFLNVKDIDYLGPLPADIQNTTVYSVGLHASAPAPEAAKALVKFLTAPGAAPAIKKMGMDPG